MVGEDLDTGADDERHEEKIQEMLHPQPHGKACGDRMSGRWDARVTHEKILHRRQFSQRLSDRDANDREHKTEWQRPQHVYPTPANPDLGHHANLGRQPVVQKNAVVRRAEIRLDGIMRRRNELSTLHITRFFGAFAITHRQPAYAGVRRHTEQKSSRPIGVGRRIPVAKARRDLRRRFRNGRNCQFDTRLFWRQ